MFAGVLGKVLGNTIARLERLLPLPQKIAAMSQQVDDLEFHGHTIDAKDCANAVTVGAHVARQRHWPRKNRSQRCIADRVTQLPLASLRCAEKANIDRFPVFVQRQHDCGAAAEIAFVFGEEPGIQCGQQRLDPIVVVTFKHS